MPLKGERFFNIDSLRQKDHRAHRGKREGVWNGRQTSSKESISTSLKSKRGGTFSFSVGHWGWTGKRGVSSHKWKEPKGGGRAKKCNSNHGKEGLTANISG